jgi:uncharacterized protein (TIGR02453 family)
MPKPDGFTLLVDEARAFFKELDANNTKEWFEPRKAHYQTHIRQPAEILCELVGEEITRLTGKRHSGKVLRIYRDVRFSKDKRPYNPHLHMVWWQGAGKNDAEAGSAWFFACSPTLLALNMGSPGFKGEGLLAWRKLIDAHGNELAEAIADTGCGLSDWGEAPLKKVPAPYDASHRQADLLKRRSLILDAPLGEAWRTEDGLLTAIIARCEKLLPVWRLLDEHLR